jgi:hypothetical protein
MLFIIMVCLIMGLAISYVQRHQPLAVELTLGAIGEFRDQGDNINN